MYLRQQLRADNDRNGNPRRVWVLYLVDGTDYGGVVDAVDEGYFGDPAGSDDPSLSRFRNSTRLPTIDVPVSEYKRFLSVG